MALASPVPESPTSEGVSRPAILAAELARFDAMLRSSDSATAVLAEWIAGMSGAENIRVRAAVRSHRTDDLPDGMLDRLEAPDASDIAFRRVWLMHGGRIFSDAGNWYVPGRLDAVMRQALEDGMTPFGSIIAPLGPVRQTLSSELLWEPVSAGESEAAKLPPKLLRHRALIHDAKGRPICEVDEVYTRNLLR